MSRERERERMENSRGMDVSRLCLDSPQQSVVRFRCVACFKQFNKKAYLVEHMERVRHSEHEPRCGCCKKHCRCLDALREHLLGPLAKKECSEQFKEKGCSLCLQFFDSPEDLTSHHVLCQLSPLEDNMHASIGMTKRVQALKHPHSSFNMEQCGDECGSAVALDCEMVGGGEDGFIDMCARICVVDENENVLLQTYVQPQLPVADYRFEVTGIKSEDLENAMPLKAVKTALEEILYNKKQSGNNCRPTKLLVGHSLIHDLNCLSMDYPQHLIRDTASYPLYLRTSNTCNKLQYLTQTYLGYCIQDDHHDPLEDAVAAMRLYKRMRRRCHVSNDPASTKNRQIFTNRKPGADLEILTPEALLHVWKPRYQCWCLDSCSVGGA